MAIQEEIIYEGRPHIGNLIVNTLMLVTVIWFPFWLGAVFSYAFTRYRFTNRRVTVEGGWLGKNRTDLIYREIQEVREIPATIAGSFMGYGVLLILLKDGSKLELNAVPKFREIGEYIRSRSNQYPNKDKKLTSSAP